MITAEPLNVSAKQNARTVDTDKQTDDAKLRNEITVMLDAVQSHPETRPRHQKRLRRFRRGFPGKRPFQRNSVSPILNKIYILFKNISRENTSTLRVEFGAVGNISVRSMPAHRAAARGKSADSARKATDFPRLASGAWPNKIIPFVQSRRTGPSDVRHGQNLQVPRPPFCMGCRRGASLRRSEFGPFPAMRRERGPLIPSYPGNSQKSSQT